MDELMRMLMEAQERQRMTAGKWIYCMVMGLLASVLVLIFSASEGISLFVAFGVFGTLVFGVALIISIVMHIRRYDDKW